MRNQNTHAAIAYLAHAIRPDWDRMGIESVLSRIDPAIELAAVAHAAIVAAATRADQKTPAVIAFDGPHWARCAGDKPALRMPTWRDPLAHATPATPEQIRAIRAARKEKS